MLVFEHKARSFVPTEQGYHFNKKERVFNYFSLTRLFKNIPKVAMEFW